MTEIEIRQVDPMVEKLWRRAGAFGFDDVEGLDLMRKITERLKRPSREEFGRKLRAFAWTNPPWPQPLGDNAARKREQELLDLACGPEPKPREKRHKYHAFPFAPCQEGSCAVCSVGEDGGSVFLLCPHPCHKEAKDD